GTEASAPAKSECTGAIYTLSHYELRAWQTGSVHVWGITEQAIANSSPGHRWRQPLPRRVRALRHHPATESRWFSWCPMAWKPAAVIRLQPPGPCTVLM